MPVGYLFVGLKLRLQKVPHTVWYFLKTQFQPHKQITNSTQGDNLAMPLFALATLPVLQHLEHYTLAYQVWLADDVAAVGTLEWLKPWWDMIVQEGIKYGYHVNDKSCLVLKHLSDLAQVLAQGHSDVSIQDRKLFGSSGIKNSCDGKRYLGSNRFNGIYRSIH